MSDPFAPIPGIHHKAEEAEHDVWMKPGHPDTFEGRRRVDIEPDGQHATVIDAERREELRRAFPKAFGLNPTQQAAVDAEYARLGLEPGIHAPGTPPPTPTKLASQMWKWRRWWRRTTHHCELCRAKVAHNRRLCSTCGGRRMGPGVDKPAPVVTSDYIPDVDDYWTGE